MLRHFNKFKKLTKLIKTRGIIASSKEVVRYLRRSVRSPHMFTYSSYVKRFDTITESDIIDIKRHISEFNQLPLISILMPVYNTDSNYLRQALDSVLSQAYTNWELCVADDCSTNTQTIDVLNEYVAKDSRIKITFRPRNGHISASSNSALGLCSGEFTALMDHDDILPRHALYYIAYVINQCNNEVDLIYTDEDKIDDRNNRYDPYFKTDWNQSLILSQNFVAHFGVYRTSLLRKINGFRTGYEGSQDYDLLLRFLEYTNKERIVHIAAVLYHWRNFKGNSSFSSKNHDVSDKSAYNALNDYLSAKIGLGNYSIRQMNLFPGTWRVNLALHSQPKISLIIPTRDMFGILSECVNGILFNTNYDNIEVIIVDNGSTDTETLRYLDEVSSQYGVVILRDDGSFNFSRLNNEAVRIATGDIVGFINNDIKVINSDWLLEMVTTLLQDGVGIVGAKLLYENQTIQHAGVVLGIYGVACHPQRHFGRNSPGYFGLAQLSHEVSAVTAACLLIHKEIFNKVDGFDEEKFAIGFNDVDLCLKVRNMGYRIVYNPFAELLHRESVSRGRDDSKEKINNHRKECKNMIELYGKQLKHDPYYNVNLSIIDESYNISSQPRYMVPWRDWVEFICPFHRGDILIAIQVCFIATRQGVNVRLHVCQDMLDWVLDFNPTFQVNAVPFNMPPKVEENLQLMSQVIDYVVSMKVFSRKLALSHKQQDFRLIGLDIVEHFLHELELPIGSKLINHKPEKIACCEELFIKNNRIVLIHPNAGWNLKSIQSHILQEVIAVLKSAHFLVVQIGGASDEQIEWCDYWILENYTPKKWRYIFENAKGIICVDSWSSHFASILDVPCLALFGPTNPKYISSKQHYISQNNVLMTNDIIECSPCDMLICPMYDKPYCSGFSSARLSVLKFINILNDKQDSNCE